MSWLDNLFGADDARRDVSAATNDANATLAGAYRRADNLLSGSRGRQINALRSGNAAANAALRKGYGQARDDLTGGYGDAIGNEQDGLDRVTGLYQPYIDRGNAAGDLYTDALGVNGSGAQQTFYDNFQVDPFFEYNQDQALRALQRQNNAGAVTGGRAILAGQRVAQEMGSQVLNDRLNRLSSLYGTAMQASDRLAGQVSNTTGRISNLQVGRGTDLAANSQRFGDAMAGQANNFATNRANVIGTNAAARADLAYGNGQQLAANRINLGNANAATRGSGMNNLINLAGTVAKGYAAFK